MWRKTLLLGLAALAGGTLGSSAYYLRDPIVERWYLWKFARGTEAQKIEAMECLIDRGSSKAIPLLLLAMEETGPRRGIGRKAALIYSFERGYWLEWATFKEARTSGEWTPDRFLKAYRQILPGWKGEFDEAGVNEFNCMLVFSFWVK